MTGFHHPRLFRARAWNHSCASPGARGTRRFGFFGRCLVVACGLAVAAAALQPGLRSGESAPPGLDRAAPGVSSPRLPRLAPDYLDVVIPPNLAPLNVAILEPGSEYRLRLSGARGQPIDLSQSQPQMRFPLESWRALLEANRGGALRWNVSVREPSGGWVTYAPIENRVAEEEIDRYVVYRRFRPLYTSYRHMGIFQRHLETFEERPVARSETIQHGCVNCHTFQQGDPDRFAISFRVRSGAPTLLVDSNGITRVDTKMGYLSWHPNGKVLAYAANTITQFFHTAGPFNRDVYDPHSDLKIFHVDSRKVETPPAIAQPDSSENWPCWAPDGRHLYFCRAPSIPFREAQEFRHDLVRIPYDPDQNRWGEAETLISGAEHGLSTHQPRVAPDGRSLVFTVSGSGSFPLFRPESDLYLLRLDTRRWEPLTINSDRAETWPGWSSNGRWLLFGSRRLDGVFARLWITHVDRDLRFSKPLLLPQEDPAYYDRCLDNFNAAELVRGPIRVSEAELVRVASPPGAAPGPDEWGPSASDPAPDASTMSDRL